MSDQKESLQKSQRYSPVTERWGPPIARQRGAPVRRPASPVRRPASPVRRPASGTIYIVTHRYVDYRNGGISTNLEICSSMEAAIDQANEFHDQHLEEHRKNKDPQDVEEYDEEGELIIYGPRDCRHPKSEERWAECDLEEADINIKEVTLDPSKGVMYSDRL